MVFISKVWRNLESTSLLRLAIVLLGISFLIRVLFIVVFHTYTDLSRYELERIAISLATQGIYGNPYAVPTGPSAHVSPGYTLILSALFKLFGTGIPAEVVKQLLASLVTSLHFALLPFAAAALQIDKRLGFLAGLTSALYPVKPLVQIDGDWETPYTALAILVLCAFTAVLWRRARLATRDGLWLGLLWGVALLFASVLLPVFLVLCAAGFYFCWSERARYLRFVLVQFALVLLCLLPWAIRNQLSLGKPVFTRSNLGIELRVSNNDFASPDQRENLLHGVYDRFHPLQNIREAKTVARLGEIRYNRFAQAQAMQWIQTHRERYLALTAGRIRCFWFYFDPTSPVKTMFLAITGLLGIGGAIWLLSADPISGMIVAGFLLLYPAPNYFIHVGLRQRFPIDWLLTLLSFYFVAKTATFVFSKSR